MFERFIYKDIFDQIIEYIEDNYPHIDYQNLAIILLKNKDEEAIEKILKYFINNLQIPKVAFYLKEEFYKLVNNDSGRLYYTFKTKIEDQFDKDFKAAENSLNTGDQIAFLCGEYLKAEKKSEITDFPLYQELQLTIGTIIAKKIYVLKTTIESQNKIDISNSLHLFLLYEKEEATAKFSKIIQQDKDSRRNKDSVMHYWVMIDILMDRLATMDDFIPKITVTGKNGIIRFSNSKNSISREELNTIINKEDHFNSNVPLANFPPEKLLNPVKDFENYGKVENLFSTLFHEEITILKGKKYWEKINLDLGKIFLNTITEPYPSYQNYDLIRTREYIKELLHSGKSDFKNRFFRLIYDLKEKDATKRWNTKFPFIFNQYLKIDGYSVATIRRFFRRDSENPIFYVEKELKT